MAHRHMWFILACVSTTSACKLNSQTITQSNETRTMKATVNTLLIGGDFQACVALAPLQIFYNSPKAQPKNKLGNTSPTDAGYEFIDIAFQPGKSAVHLFNDGQKLYMLDEKGNKKACTLTSVYYAKKDWTAVTIAKTSAKTSDKPKESKITVMDQPKQLTQANEFLGVFSQASFFKLSGTQQAADIDADSKCGVDEGTVLQGILLKLETNRPEHMLFELTRDLKTGSSPFCLKGTKGYIYVGHLKGKAFAVNPAQDVEFKKTAATTTDICKFKGELTANLIDYAQANGISYFKVQLTGALPNVQQEKDFCKKDSVGYIAINQLAK